MGLSMRQPNAFGFDTPCSCGPLRLRGRFSGVPSKAADHVGDSPRSEDPMLSVSSFIE